MVQVKQTDEIRAIGRAISFLYRKCQTFLNHELKPYNLNSSEYIFLINIADDEAVKQKRLSEKLFIDNGLTTRCLISLEKKGYIVRRQDATDGRAVLVSLSEKGRAMRPIILKLLEKWAHILAADMTAEQIDSFLLLSAQMVRNVAGDEK